MKINNTHLPHLNALRSFNTLTLPTDPHTRANNSLCPGDSITTRHLVAGLDTDLRIGAFNSAWLITRTSGGEEHGDGGEA